MDLQKNIFQFNLTFELLDALGMLSIIKDIVKLSYLQRIKKLR